MLKMAAKPVVQRMSKPDQPEGFLNPLRLPTALLLWFLKWNSYVCAPKITGSLISSHQVVHPQAPFVLVSALSLGYLSTTPPTTAIKMRESHQQNARGHQRKRSLGWMAEADILDRCPCDNSFRDDEEGLSEKKNILMSSNPPDRSSVCHASTPRLRTAAPHFCPFGPCFSATGSNLV